MKTKEALQLLAPSQLKAMARSNKISVLVEETSQAELLFSLEAHLTSPAQTGERWASLTSYEQTFLSLFIRCAATEAVPFRQIEAWMAEGMTGAEQKVAIVKLREKGMLFAIRKLWGETLYFIPEDQFHVWFNYFYANGLHERESQLLISEIIVKEAASPGIHYDLLTFLLFVRDETLTLTQKGNLHKRLIGKAVERLNLNHRHLQGMSLRYNDQEVYPRSLAVILDMALRLGWVVKSVDRIGLDCAGLETWLNRSPSTIFRELIAFWKQVHVLPKPWLMLALTAMESVKLGSWQSLNELCIWMKDQQIPVDVTDTERWIYDEILLPFCGLGLIDIGEKGEETYWRWASDTGFCVSPQEAEETDALARKQPFYIQPNFELLVPSEVSFLTRWQLAAFAELQKNDHMSLYRITKESIHQAMERGNAMEQIMAMLKDYSFYEIPENVEMMLRQWGEQYGRIRFIDAMLMRCADTSLGNELAGHPQASKWIVQRISDVDFIIHREHVKECMELLERNGYAPRRIIESMEESKQATSINTPKNQDNGKPRQGIVMSRNALTHFQIEPVIPMMEEVFPQVKKIPTVWTQSLRTYHESTLRELIQQAIMLKTKIRCRGNNEETQLVPSRLSEKNGRWFVEAKRNNQESVTIPIAQMDEVMLLIPGITENV